MSTDACPRCGYKIDAHTCMTDPDAIPVEGDISMCLDCGAILINEADLAMHEITEAETFALPPETRTLLLRMGNARQVVVAAKKAKQT